MKTSPQSWQDFGIILGDTSGRDEVDVTCPQCSASRKKKNAKCLSVNISKETWFCHHCGWRGGLTRGEVERSNPYLWKPKVYAKPTYPVDLGVSDDVSAWLLNRGISVAVAERNRVANGFIYMPQTEQRETVIQFPYYRDGELINVKYRTVKDKHFRMVAGAERILYGLDDLKDQECAIFVEGECDKLSLEEAGFRNCVSVPDGAPAVGTKNYSMKLDYLERCAPLLDPLKEIIIAVDTDEPGYILQQELIRRLGPERCWRVTWPDGCKDANDVLMTYGVSVVREAIDGAKECPLVGVSDAWDFVEDYVQLYHQGMQGGESTGWPNVDTCYTVKPGQLTVITGVPSHGKSSFLDAMLVNLAQSVGWRFGLYTPESYPHARHLAGLVSRKIGKPFRQWEWSPAERMTEEEMHEGLQWAYQHFWYLGQGEESISSLSQLLEQAKGLVKRFGINGLVLDPWNEIEHDYDPHTSETQYISKCLTLCRRFARTYGVHVWIVAHPTKLYRNKEGQYPIPTPYDISGSSNFRNKPDVCITIWRDLENRTKPVEVHVQKMRFQECGQIGLQFLLFDPVTGRYTPM